MKKTIKQFRIEKNMTQDSLAKATGISLRTISSIENDKKYILSLSFKKILEIESALDMDIHNVDY